VSEFAGNQRTVPLPPDQVERVVDVLGLQYEGDLSDRDWYNAYRHLRSEGEATSERLAGRLVDDIRDTVEQRKTTDIDGMVRWDLEAAAKGCGISLTDIVDGTDLSKYRVWQAYEEEQAPDDAIQFVAATYTDRIREADQVTEYLEKLMNGDVFYDPIEEIESEPYDGPVIGLSVPRTHNYVAGFGACGINHNTFVLPEAQRDRFQLKLTVDLPERDHERTLLDRFDDDPELAPERAESVVTPADVLAARDAVTRTHVEDAVKEYILDLVSATRTNPDVDHGASPRASLAFLNAAKARAAIRGRDYVIPDDVKALAEPVLVHRLVLGTDAELGDRSPSEIVRNTVDSVEPPGSIGDGAVVEREAVGDGGPVDSEDADEE
jgi:hypothetical protein